MPRQQQRVLPSDPLPLGAGIPQLPQDEATGRLGSSSYAPSEVTPTQLEEVRLGMEILREEMRETASSTASQQRAFENRMTAHLTVVQNTIVQCLVHRPVSSQPQTSAPASPSTFTFGSLTEADLAIPHTPATTSAIATIDSPQTPTLSATLPPSLSQTANPYTPLNPISLSQTTYPCQTHNPTSTLSLFLTLSIIFQQNQRPQLPIHHQIQQPPIPNFPPLYRHPKIYLLRFMGDDSTGWFVMAERYLRGQQVPHGERIATLGAHFGPTPSMWMNFFEQRHPNATWEEFVAAFLEHFGGSTNADYKATLSHLRQRTTVDAFVGEFTLLACRVPEWGDTDLVLMFIGGLKPEIRQDVAVIEPYTLATAQCIARRFETKLVESHNMRPSRPFPWSATTRPTLSSSSTSAQSATAHQAHDQSQLQTHQTPSKPAVNQPNKWWASNNERFV